MLRLDVSFPSRSFPASLSRIALFSLIAVAAAGCADSARFNTADNNVPPRDVTGTVVSRAPAARVETQPLASPAAPVASYSTPTYHPSAPPVQVASAPRYEQPSASGHWTWDGGSPVIVARGDTIESIARHYGVPAAAIRRANGFAEGAMLRPGQRIVIPRYASTAARSHVAAVEHKPKGDEIIHTVAAGETLASVSRKYGVTLTTVARANNMRTNAPLRVGERLTIPGGRQQMAALPAPVPHAAAPRNVKIESVGTVPAQNAHLAVEETKAASESPAKSAQAVGSLPAFRWPAHGRVTVAFGAKVNGVTNDGINLAVPQGTPVKAADDGVVAYAGNELKGYGNLVLLRHPNGYVSAYANASELLVKKGDTVKRGQVIAHSGQTGDATSPQLHFEIRKGSVPVDPMQFLGGA